MSDIHSNPYHPDPGHCCERCVFGSGEHAEFCGQAWDEAWDEEDQELLSWAGLPDDEGFWDVNNLEPSSWSPDSKRSVKRSEGSHSLKQP